MADILVKVRVGYHYIVNESLYHSSEDEPFNVSEKNYSMQKWKLEKVDASGTPLSIIEAEKTKNLTEDKDKVKTTEQESSNEVEGAKLEAEAGKNDEDLSDEDEKEVAEQEEKEDEKEEEAPKKKNRRAKRK